MELINLQFLEDNYSEIKEDALFGRWIQIEDIEPLYKKVSDKISVVLLGTSEENRPIYKLRLGSGAKKILVWSQMHGNESTGTKAVFDFLNFIKLFSTDKITQTILNECTIEIIPMLNPDGAFAYTRVNANNVDLNRDAVDKKAKESNLLRSVLDEFNPKFCFNLHDQRTIFGVDDTKNPATISFLAPSEEQTRAITNGRKETMNVIAAMDKLLQQIIPHHIGRYTDEFYPTATGDNFQKLGHNTILIEAGHYPDDYERENVRKYNFYAFLQGLYHIALTDDFSEYEPYFNIPNNVKSFFDVIHRYKDKNDVAFQYKEQIVDNTFVLNLEKQEVENASNYFAHREITFND